jgi:c-di-GMP-binding flagellar brake protein YcgR
MYDGVQRSSPRVVIYCPVKLWGDTEVHEGVCINVSRGGMALSVAHRLQVGVLLRVSLLLPSDCQVDATCEVVWARGRGLENRIGVRFITLVERARSALDQFIAQELAAA